MIADKNFYRFVLILVIPMIIQAAITNFVSLLDNIMVGQIGTAQMSGVSIVNQFVFVFNLTMFGAVSGPSIFGAQFFGKRDVEGQRYTVRFRLWMAIIICVIGIAVLFAFRSQLISLFLSKDDAPEMIAATLSYGLAYLKVAVISLIPFAFGQVYASVIRECGHTQIPMIASFVAVGVNLVLDYGLIFGHFGLPELGVQGAAWATVAAKIIEALIMIIWAHTHTEKNPYIIDLYKSFKIPGQLAWEIFKKSMPLLANEFLWSAGMSIIAQCYSVRGIDVVAARNIASTINNMFNVVYIQLGAGIGIIMGQLLGAGRHKEARERNSQLLFFTFIVSLILMAGLFPLAKIFPQVYNTEDTIRKIATYFIMIQALAVPICSYANATYFTLRSGGKTWLTFFFDFGFTWAVMIPLAFCLSRFTSMDIHFLFAIVTFSEGIKVIIGTFLIRSDIWIHTIEWK